MLQKYLEYKTSNLNLINLNRILFCLRWYELDCTALDLNRSFFFYTLG